MDLKNSKTYENLKIAFAGEAQARTKYDFYASKAKKEGYEQIAEVFTKTAHNEKEHAKIWFKLLYDKVPDTVTNLYDAAKGENYEWTNMYEEFAKVADLEGFSDIANTFREIGKIEKHHEEMYLRIAKSIKEEKVFQEEKPIAWICRNCGYVHFADSAPEECPVCNHAKAYFERKVEPLNV